MTADTDKQRILLGIGGGVAAYKAVAVASQLGKDGYDVQVAMTPAAQRFVTPLTFSAITGKDALCDVFPDGIYDRKSAYPHLYPATEVDACVLLPATADLIAHVAHGFGSNIVTTSVLSLTASCQRFCCPAMNVEMWQQPAVSENVQRMTAHGWQMIGPAAGQLACGTVGIGRMAEPEEICQRVQDALRQNGALSGRRVLILSGPTVEAIDPVRFISNRSSGRMGRALAEAAVAEGADVHMITGPVPCDALPDRIDITHVESAMDMLAAGRQHVADADAVIFVAAVADYRVAEPAEQKLPKDKSRTLSLVANADIAAELTKTKPAAQVTIGFALETDDGLRKAADKLSRKALDAIVLNGADSMGADSGTFTWLQAGAADTPQQWGVLDKVRCAQRVMDSLATLLRDRGDND